MALMALMAMLAMPLLISTLWLPHYFRYLHAVLQTKYIFLKMLDVWQQDSGKGPRIGDGAGYCVPDLTPHTLST